MHTSASRFDRLVSCAVLSPLLLLGISLTFAGPPRSKADVEAAIASGQLSYRLTELPEVIALYGEPEKTENLRDGEMSLQLLHYPDTILAFGKRQASQSPFVLVAIVFHGERLDAGKYGKLTLRNEKDLTKLDEFSGFQNVSLVRLDFSNRLDLLEKMPFDSETEWPPAERLPPGFDPAIRLRAGLDPGLGLRELHKKGIDGKGVGIAIIDQPLVRDHIEYRDAIKSYELIGVEGVPPQMHGPAVASIAVGENRGVAPGSRLTFFAIPMWKRENQPYIDAMKRILDLNRASSGGEKIRVVSISTGMFKEQAHYEEWLQVLKEVEESGVFVITCDQEAFAYGTLVRLPGRDPDDPEAYRSGRYRGPNSALLVPVGNMMRASQAGTEAYAFDPEGGISWAAPYIGGLAALGCQVNQQVSPAQIRAALYELSNNYERRPSG